MIAGVGSVPTAFLEDLLRGVRSGKFACPFVTEDLVLGGLGRAAKGLAPLCNRDEATVLAVLEFVLAERSQRAARELELVWTGPDTAGASVRDSEIVLGDLFRRAEKTVLVAGYSFSGGGAVLEQLYEGMRDRSVQASLFFDLHQVHERPPELSLQVYSEFCVRVFLEKVWVFGPPYPTLYVDARMLDEDSWRGSFPKYSLHAKCAVIDSREALVTSANFTGRGQRKNVELGVLIQEAAFAKQIEAQFSRLIMSRAMKRVWLGA
jgi:phosphatidylserine/phosphatidylglycerophosphate/cardiolipin synthase-like enzyme